MCPQIGPNVNFTRVWPMSFVGPSFSVLFGSKLYLQISWGNFFWKTWRTCSFSIFKLTTAIKGSWYILVEIARLAVLDSLEVWNKSQLNRKNLPGGFFFFEIGFCFLISVKRLNQRFLTDHMILLLHILQTIKFFIDQQWTINTSLSARKKKWTARSSQKQPKKKANLD